MLYIGTFIFRPRFFIHAERLLDYRDGAVAGKCSLLRSWQRLWRNCTDHWNRVGYVTMDSVLLYGD